MSCISKNVSSLWADVCRAIVNKESDPLAFDRIFIGGSQKQASSPIHNRKTSSVQNGGRREYFILSEPLSGVPLTRRELQVLFLICQGLTNTLVAKRIGLSSRTIEYYIKNMRKKTLALNKADLVDQVLKTDFSTRVNEMVLDEWHR